MTEHSIYDPPKQPGWYLVGYKVWDRDGNDEYDAKQCYYDGESWDIPHGASDPRWKA